MILVSGYYGFKNSGDEAMLAALCEDLEVLNIARENIVVFSGNPNYTRRIHRVKAVSRNNPMEIIKAFKGGKLLISGGGSLLQDSTGHLTVPYYLGMIELALFFNLRVLIYGQGIGPVKNRIYQRWIGNTFSRVHGITLRDQYSMKLLKVWGVMEEKLTLAADCVFSKHITDNGPVELGSKQRAISINLRPYEKWKQDSVKWAELISFWIFKHKFPVYFVPLGPGDRELAMDLIREVPEMKVLVPEDWSVALDYLGKTEYCISMRLHGLIFAAISNTLPIGLSYDPKVDSLCQQLGITTRATSPSYKLTDDLRELERNKTVYREKLRIQVGNLVDFSLNNRRLLETELSYLSGVNRNEAH